MNLNQQDQRNLWEKINKLREVTLQQKNFADYQIENLDNEYRTENNSTIKSEFLEENNQRLMPKDKKQSLNSLREIVEDDNENEQEKEIAINYLNEWFSPSLKDIGDK